MILSLTVCGVALLLGAASLGATWRNIRALKSRYATEAAQLAAQKTAMEARHRKENEDMRQWAEDVRAQLRKSRDVGAQL